MSTNTWRRIFFDNLSPYSSLIFSNLVTVDPGSHIELLLLLGCNFHDRCASLTAILGFFHIQFPHCYSPLQRLLSFPLFICLFVSLLKQNLQVLYRLIFIQLPASFICKQIMIMCSKFIFNDHLLYDLTAIYNEQIFCRLSDCFVKEFVLSCWDL